MNMSMVKLVTVAFLIFFAGLFTRGIPVFAEIDLAEERASMIEDMGQQAEDIGEIEDVFFGDDLSEEEIDKILTEAPMPVKVEIAKPAPVKEKPVQITKVVETPKIVVKEEPKVVALKPVPVKEKPAQIVKAVEPPKEIVTEMPKELPQVKKEAVYEPKQVSVPVVVKEPVKIEIPKLAPVKEKSVQVAKAVEMPRVITVEKEIEQPAGKKGASPAKKITLKELQSRLGLSDSQMKRLAPIMKQKGQKRVEIIKKFAGKGMSAKAAMKKELAMFTDYYDDMYSHIMTEEQWDRYLAIRQEMKS